MKNRFYKIPSEEGFTLLELVIAMFLTVIVSTAIYMAYNSQHKSYTVQEQVSDMQQNLRAAMYFMQKDIRMAGTDPALKAGGGGQADAKIVIANVGELEFTMDIAGGETDNIDNDKDSLVDENGEWFDGGLGDAGEQVRFKLDNDADDDGVADGGVPCTLGRDVDGAGLNDIAENIETLNFVYLDSGGNTLDDDGSGNVVASIDDIRQIQVTITARSERRDPEFTSASGDNFRRRTLTMTITPRNIILR
jgi:prepilin-type N-terminal cleavage/methylation domain-containing protein